MKYKTIIYLLLSGLLASCAAAVIVGAASGVAVYDRRSVAMIERDARIFYVVNKTIVSDSRFRDSHIVVSSFNQVVLLVGQTPTASLRVLAEKIAQGTPNVRHIYNEVTIDYPSSISQRSKDSLVTAEIRSKMLAKKGLESGSIRIVTENGIVYLMGIATREQADLAVSVAREINGVAKVVKLFQYVA